jgi:hypothetical protein
MLQIIGPYTVSVRRISLQVVSDSSHARFRITGVEHTSNAEPCVCHFPSARYRRKSLTLPSECSHPLVHSCPLLNILDIDNKKLIN